MTRRIARILCSLALLLAAAPAASAAPVGEIVLVASGTAAGTITLPAAAVPGFGGAKYQMRSPYAVVAFIHGGQAVAAANHFPALGDNGDDVLILPGRVPAGRSEVRLRDLVEVQHALTQVFNYKGL